MPAAKTDLLDRYLHAVKFWLPKAQQKDILAELDEDLHSQIEDREAALGRPLAEDELAAVLQKRGSPMRVAGSFLPEQRLINPAMLPVYRLVLKITLLWVLLPLFVIVFIGPMFNSPHPVSVMLAFLVEAWRTLFTVIGIVTVVFAILDRYHVSAKALDQWDPRKLPRVPASTESATRWNHLAGFIFGTLAAFLWAWFMWHRTTFSFPGDIQVILGPIWKYLYLPVLALTMTSASADLLAFLHPCWAPTRSRVRIGVDACMLILLAVVYLAGDWAEIHVASLSPADFANVTRWVDLSIRVSLFATAVITVGDATMELRRLFRSGRSTPVRTAAA